MRIRGGLPGPDGPCPWRRLRRAFGVLAGGRTFARTPQGVRGRVRGPAGSSVRSGGARVRRCGRAHRVLRGTACAGYEAFAVMAGRRPEQVMFEALHGQRARHQRDRYEHSQPCLRHEFHPDSVASSLRIGRIRQHSAPIHRVRRRRVTAEPSPCCPHDHCGLCMTFTCGPACPHPADHATASARRRGSAGRVGREAGGICVPVGTWQPDMALMCHIGRSRGPRHVPPWRGGR
jgi:hypothetical protein